MEELFSALPTSERILSIHELQLETLDSTTFLSFYTPLIEMAKGERDWQMEWVLDFYYFLQRGEMKSTPQENIDLLTSLKERAENNNFRVGEITARHYLLFEEYYAGQLLFGELYTHILKEFEEIQKVGVEKFENYTLSWMLYHNAKFIYEVGDMEQAFQLFQIAEPFIRPTNRDRHACVLILNHLQAIYHTRKEYEQGLGYARRILDFVQSHPPTDSAGQLFYYQWKGLVLIDIANILVKQGKYEESEKVVKEGYSLAKAYDVSNRIQLRLEYDALQVLVSTKLEMGQLEEVEPLLRRLDELYRTIGGEYENYFNNLEYFECRYRFHEMKGDFAEAVHFAELANPLRDSLERRNDARKQEQLKQRLEAQKHGEQIRLLAQEKELQKTQRSAAFVILTLVLLLAFFYFRRLNRQRKQRLAELKKAKRELAEKTESFRKKSAMAEKLRLEMEQLARSGQHSEYLEKLLSSAILTEEDWIQFRQLFEKVHPGFLSEKKAIQPGLTPSELRYLALTKLDLSTNEMANMLGVSNGAIRQTKARLRKKMA